MTVAAEQEKITQPYVGIAGFTTPAEVESTLAVLPHHGTHLLGVGALVRGTTLSGEMPRRHRKRHPPLARLPELFTDDDRAVNIVHYTARDDDPLAVGVDLGTIIKHAGPNLHGFQLNWPWPNPAIARSLRKRGYRVVLRVDQPALRMLKSQGELARRLLQYGGDATDVAFTFGKQGFDPDAAWLLMTTALGVFDCAVAKERAALPRLGVGVAARFNAASLPEIRRLHGAYLPPFNVHTVGGVRDPDTDALDLDEARAFVKRVAGMFLAATDS